MTSCCTDFTTAAEELFTDRVAARDLRRYRKKGPLWTARLLLEGLAGAGPITGCLLDIGTGVGSLAFELLDAGVTKVIAVDASAAHIAAASREAVRRKRSNAIQFVHGDFVTVASELPATAIVTMDRVICCYAAAESLLIEALCRAEHYFGLSYPRNTWYVRAANAVINGKRRFMGKQFRTFIHSAEAMSQVIERAGFVLRTRRHTWTWSVDVYEKGILP